MSAARDPRFDQPATMTVAEFLAWDPGGDQRWQLVDGEPRAMAPAKRTHGALQAEVAAVLRNHLLERGSPCSVIDAPGLVPRVRSEHNFRIPDLAVTCSPYSEEEDMLEGAVLVIEILSPSNRAETWSAVWTYTSIPSVQEILVLHTTGIVAELLRRQPDGNWPAEPARLTEGELVLASIGLRTPLAALYRTTRLAVT